MNPRVPEQEPTLRTQSRGPERFRLLSMPEDADLRGFSRSV